MKKIITLCIAALLLVTACSVVGVFAAELQEENISYIPGDVNRDSQVTDTDVALLRQYITGADDTDVYIPACDVNDDGIINGSDVVLISRYIAGGYGVELKPSKLCNHDVIKAVDSALVEDTAQIVYLCQSCSELINKPNTAITAEEYQKTDVFDVATAFEFYIISEKSEAQIKESLKIIDSYYAGSEYESHESVAQDYALEAVEDNIWKVKHTSSYSEGTTYLVSLDEEDSFRDSTGNTLKFTTAKGETEKIKYKDGIKFLHTMEQESPGYYPYSLDTETDEEYAYVTLHKADNLAVGDTVCIGEAQSVNEVMTAMDEEALFAKVEAISENADGTWTLTLGTPSLSDIFETFEVYKETSVDFDDPEVVLADNIEEQAVSAFCVSDGFIELLAAVDLAAEEYVKEYDCNTVPLSASSFADRINIDADVTMQGNKLTAYFNGTITVPVTQNGKQLGSLKVGFKTACDIIYDVVVNYELEQAEINKNEIKHFDIRLDQTYAFVFEFFINFDIDYSLNGATNPYVLNINTTTLHDRECVVCNGLSEESKTELTKEEFLKLYYDGYKECRRCHPYLNLSNTNFVINSNSRVFHAVHCMHVKNASGSNWSVTAMRSDELSKLNYTPCKDCMPNSHELKDFEEMVLSSFGYADWGNKVAEITSIAREACINEYSKKGYQIAKLPYMVVPGINIELSVNLVLEFNLSASLNYKYTKELTYSCGIRYSHDGFETYSDPIKSQKAKQDFTIIGEVHFKCGVEAELYVTITGLSKWLKVGLSAGAGVYSDASGIYSISSSQSGNTRYAAAYFEIGIYAEINAFYKLLCWEDNKTLVEGKFPFFAKGYDRAYYAFAEQPETLEITDNYELQADDLLKVKYFDLKTIAAAEETLKFEDPSDDYTVTLRLVDNKYCRLVNGVIDVFDNAPRSFTATLVVTVKGNSDWRDYEEGNGAFYLQDYTVELCYTYYETYSSGLSFKSNGDGTCYVSGIGTCTDTDVIIPRFSPNGNRVTGIGDYAFEYCRSLTSITIPDGVTSISYAAFYNCTSLTSITISDGVTSIGKYAFYKCTSLTSITIPDSVTSMGEYAFSECTSLTSITIPDSVTYMGEYAFCRCTSLTSITIPDGVTSISYAAFYNCASLTSITIPDGVTSILRSAFEYCPSLTSITIPDSVTSIGAEAFQSCRSLTSITIPDSVTFIGERAFEYCNALESIIVAEGNPVYKSIDNCIIYQNTNTLILGCCNSVIPDGVTSIGVGAFQGCRSLTSITIPDSVTSISHAAFYGCTRLTSITIPDSVTSIDKWAFYSCYNLTHITFTGTTNQWKAISKGDEWDGGTGNYTVTCTDGIISK